MRFASPADKRIWVLSLIGMIIYSATRPLYAVMLGRNVNGMSGAAVKDES